MLKLLHNSEAGAHKKRLIYGYLGKLTYQIVIWLLVYYLLFLLCNEPSIG